MPQSHATVIIHGMSRWLASLTLLAASHGLAHATPNCGSEGVTVQVLGSGGPELDDQRASSGYLIWRDGHARVLVDLGPGSLLQFERSGARVEDLDAILLSHLHVDHSADLPALVKGSYFSERNHELPVYGPTGNTLMPDAEAFVHTLFAAPDGAFHYLGDFLGDEAAYRLQPHNVPATGKDSTTVLDQHDLRLTAIPVHHGPIPALAWLVDVDGRNIAFSGDMNGDWHTLERLAKGVDLLVVDHAIPEDAEGVARKLHMPPSVIGRIAQGSGAGQLLLSHRMRRSLGHEVESEAIIRKSYAGPIRFAEDGMCIPILPAATESASH